MIKLEDGEHRLKLLKAEDVIVYGYETPALAVKAAVVESTAHLKGSQVYFMVSKTRGEWAQRLASAPVGVEFIARKKTGAHKRVHWQFSEVST